MGVKGGRRNPKTVFEKLLFAKILQWKQKIVCEVIITSELLLSVWGPVESDKAHMKEVILMFYSKQCTETFKDT